MKIEHFVLRCDCWFNFIVVAGIVVVDFYSNFENEDTHWMVAAVIFKKKFWYL